MQAPRLAVSYAAAAAVVVVVPALAAQTHATREAKKRAIAHLAATEQRLALPRGFVPQHSRDLQLRVAR